MISCCSSELSAEGRWSASGLFVPTIAKPVFNDWCIPFIVQPSTNTCRKTWFFLIETTGASSIMFGALGATTGALGIMFGALWATTGALWKMIRIVGIMIGACGATNGKRRCIHSPPRAMPGC
jgi:hypothetical protein